MRFLTPNQMKNVAQERQQALEADLAEEVQHGEQVREALQTDEYAQLMHRRRVRVAVALIVIVVVVCLGLAILALSGRV